MELVFILLFLQCKDQILEDCFHSWVVGTGTVLDSHRIFSLRLTCVCVLQYNRSGGWAESTAIGWAGGAHSHILLPSLVSGVLNNYSLIF